MDKNSLILILKEHFQGEGSEGNGAYLNFVDGTNLLIAGFPSFFSSHFVVENKYALNGEEICETVCIPYSSVIYLTLVTLDNLKKLYDYENKIIKSNEDDDVFEDTVRY